MSKEKIEFYTTSKQYQEILVIVAISSLSKNASLEVFALLSQTEPKKLIGRKLSFESEEMIERLGGIDAIKNVAINEIELLIHQHFNSKFKSFELHDYKALEFNTTDDSKLDEYWIRAHHTSEIYKIMKETSNKVLKEKLQGVTKLGQIQYS